MRNFIEASALWDFLGHLGPKWTIFTPIAGIFLLCATKKITSASPSGALVVRVACTSNLRLSLDIVSDPIYYRTL